MKRLGLAKLLSDPPKRRGENRERMYSGAGKKAYVLVAQRYCGRKLFIIAHTEGRNSPVYLLMTSLRPFFPNLLR